MQAESQTTPKYSKGTAVTVVNGYERETTQTFSRGMTSGSQPFPSRLSQPSAPRPAKGRGRAETLSFLQPGGPRAMGPSWTNSQRCQHTHLIGQLHLRSHSDPAAFPPPLQALCFDSRLRSPRRRRQAHPPLPLPYRTAPVVKPTPFSFPRSAPSSTPPLPPCPLRAGSAGNLGGAGPRGPAASSGSVPSR